MTNDHSADSPALPRLAPRATDSHKGDYGRALLIGGSRGMSGAISLAGAATLRSGAGLVTLAVPDVCQNTVAAHEPSYMTVALTNDDEGRISFLAKDRIAEAADSVTCIACGPGIGRSNALTELVSWLYASVPTPAVFDADALFALAQAKVDLSSHAGPRILTPHPGEFRRLSLNDETDRNKLESQAVQMAQVSGIVVVLKGHRTLITDGSSNVHNETGNPGMATGGSGDVLTGVVTALLAQGLQPFQAAQLGCHVHGLAGDLAADQLGQVSLIASDLIDWLPDAFQAIEDE